MCVCGKVVLIDGEDKADTSRSIPKTTTTTATRITCCHLSVSLLLILKSLAMRLRHLQSTYPTHPSKDFSGTVELSSIKLPTQFDGVHSVDNAA